MHKSVLFVLACVIAALAVPATALALHENDPRSRNMIVEGHLQWTQNVTQDTTKANDVTLSDIAFWRNYAIQGAYDGFRFVDISDPNNPVQVSDTTCGAPDTAPAGQRNPNGQGDITISPDGNVLVRSQDSGRSLPANDLALACTPGTAGSTQNGFEGLQIFNTSNKAAPVFVKAVFTDFGSHTHTQYHDKANNRLIIYVSRSGSRPRQYTAGQPYGGQNWPAGVGLHHGRRGPAAEPGRGPGRQPVHSGRDERLS